jgi:hypothetical protein
VLVVTEMAQEPFVRKDCDRLRRVIHRAGAKITE